MSKVYVKETTEHDEEGQPLKVIQTYEHKIEKPTYIVFLEK